MSLSIGTECGPMRIVFYSSWLVQNAEYFKFLFWAKSDCPLRAWNVQHNSRGGHQPGHKSFEKASKFASVMCPNVLFDILGSINVPYNTHAEAKVVHIFETILWVFACVSFAGGAIIKFYDYFLLERSRHILSPIWCRSNVPYWGHLIRIIHISWWSVC